MRGGAVSSWKGIVVGFGKLGRKGRWGSSSWLCP